MAAMDIAAVTQRLNENFAPWILDLRPTVEAAGADGVRLRVPYSERLCRVGGILCGQALVAAADTTMVLALAAAAGTFRPLTTVDLTINYMRPIVGVDAVLSAKVMRMGKTMAFCTTEITEGKEGKLAAFATGTFALVG
jgi:uncharacterized protein (TIGR00369 family)